MKTSSMTLLFALLGLGTGAHAEKCSPILSLNRLLQDDRYGLELAVGSDPGRVIKDVLWRHAEVDQALKKHPELASRFGQMSIAETAFRLEIPAATYQAFYNEAIRYASVMSESAQTVAEIEKKALATLQSEGAVIWTQDVLPAPVAGKKILLVRSQKECIKGLLAAEALTLLVRSLPDTIVYYTESPLLLQATGVKGDSFIQASNLFGTPTDRTTRLLEEPVLTVIHSDGKHSPPIFRLGNTTERLWDQISGGKNNP